jgi:predicted small lipoprotein YifL
MEVMNKVIFSILIVFGLAACGVKGRPLPPQELPSIGAGEPIYLNKKDEKKYNQKR